MRACVADLARGAVGVPAAADYVGIRAAASRAVAGVADVIGGAVAVRRGRGADCGGREVSARVVGNRVAGRNAIACHCFARTGSRVVILVGRAR